MSDLVPRRPGEPEPERKPELDVADPEFTRRVIAAAGKGQVALLVTDAQGVIIVGVKGTGGLTKLKLDAEGRLLFEGAMGGKPQVLDGSYALRNQLGADRTPERYEPEGRPRFDIDAGTDPPPAFVCPDCGAKSWHPEDGRQGYCARCHRFTGRQAVVPLPELEPGHVPMPPYPPGQRLPYERPTLTKGEDAPPGYQGSSVAGELPRRKPGATLERAEREWGPT